MTDASMKKCTKCGPKPRSEFHKSLTASDGLQSLCKPCQRKAQQEYRRKNKAKHLQAPVVVVAAPPPEFEIDLEGFDGSLTDEEPTVDPVEVKAEARLQQAQRRLASEYEPIKPGDLGTKDDYRAPNYDREKKQEFNEGMGEFMDFARGKDVDVDKIGSLISRMVEQESRWMNKRQARIHTLTHVREMLIARRFEILSKDLEWPQTFGTYAPRVKKSPAKRIVNVLLTDLHCGATLPNDENPIPFDVNTFNRRLAYVMRQVCDYKPQYRDDSSLNMLFGGDGIEGELQHSTQLDQDPLPVQLVAFARAQYAAIVYAASMYPQVDVWALGGNHGRDKLMHHGRALSSRQFNFERAVALMVADRCKHLPNVTFHIPKAAVAVVPLFDKILFLLHGDAEAKLKAPSASGGHASWQQAIDKFNAEKLWAAQCDVLCGGHFHDPSLMYFDTGIAVANGMLVPPAGYGRAGGYRGPCGQFLFESVPGFPVGDSRYVRVGVEQDRDSSLDEIIPPFVW